MSQIASQISDTQAAAPRPLSLFRWIWRAYARNALIPLLVVELLLVAAYLASHAWSRQENIEALRSIARAEVESVALDRSAIIEQQLLQVTTLTELLRREAITALATPVRGRPVRSRYRSGPDGLLTTARNDGGAAVFYSAITPKGPAQLDKLARTATLDPVLRDITDASPLVVQAYLNTHDSLNRIWPWVDSAAQFDPHMDIPAFNFYYEADARRNPDRAVVWTDAYVDPAGLGWMVSAIAPVYAGDFLEGVVGADVTLDRMINELLNRPVPWSGFMLLIGKGGTLLALPPAGEALFSLQELTGYDYVTAIRRDTFKPEEFNVYRRRDFASIGALLAARPRGSALLPGPSPHLVSWNTIPATGWKLLVLVPEAQVFAPVRELADDLAMIGWIMLGGLAGFYALFFSFLYWRARRVGEDIAVPLQQIEDLSRRVAGGDYNLDSPRFAVREFQQTVDSVVQMGARLGESNAARAAAEESLTARSEEMAQLLEFSPNGIVSFSRDGLVSLSNPAFLQMSGWSRAELVGLDRSHFWQRVQDWSPGAKMPPAPGEVARLRIAGEPERVLECRVANSQDGGEVGYFRDITDAYQLDRMKSQFLATAAHELRTPMAVISGYTEFLQSTELSAAERQQVLGTMRRHGDQVASIVGELLDLARIEAGAGRDFRMRRQPLESLVRAFAGTFRLGSDARVPQVSGQLDAAEAMLDSDKFCQALGNVLSNAYKYSEPAEPIGVALRSGPHEVGVGVRDYGCGMDAVELQRIFEWFYRGESAAQVPGSGLGMCIVKEIMDIHGGRVEIDSEPGRGTTVTLWLPRAADAG